MEFRAYILVFMLVAFLLPSLVKVKGLEIGPSPSALRNQTLLEGFIADRPLNGSQPNLCVMISDRPVEYRNRLCHRRSNSTILNIDKYHRENILNLLQGADVKSFWIPRQKAAGFDTNKNCSIAVVNQTGVAYEMRQCNERHYIFCIFEPTSQTLNTCRANERQRRAIFITRSQTFNLTITQDKKSKNIVSNSSHNQSAGSMTMKNMTNPKGSKQYTFAMFLNIPLPIAPIDFNSIIGSKADDFFWNTFMKAYPQNDKFQKLNVHSFKGMKNESINEDHKTILVLCHVSASLNNSVLDENKQESNNELNEGNLGIHHDINNSTVDDSEEVSSDKYGKDNFTIRYDIVERMNIRKLLTDLLKLNNASIFSVNSTEFCLPEFLPNNSNNFWLPATPGQTSKTKKPCLQSNGLQITRRCLGEFVYGAMWEIVENKQLLCQQNITRNLLANKLIDIDHSDRPKKHPVKTMTDVKEIIQKTHNNLNPDDIQHLSNIVQTVSTEVISLRSMTNIQNLTKTLICDATCIFDNLLKVKVDVMRSTIKLNSTNILLDGFERLIDEISTISRHSLVEVTNFEDENIKIINNQDGAVVWIAPNLMLCVIDPNVANITGMAFYTSKTNKGGIFEDNNNYRFLHSNQSVEELLEEDDLQLASFVPGTLLNRLVETMSQTKHLNLEDVPHLRIVIKVFTNDILFQEVSNSTNEKVYNKIISVSIPGYDRNLPELLPLIMRKPSANIEADKSCRYWNYSTWSEEGIQFLGTSTKGKHLVWCGSSHLTSFGYLIGVTMISASHRKALDIITLIGCSVSLIGIIIVFITALLFDKWRQKLSSKVLLQLSLAIALQMILFCFVNTQDYTSHLIANEKFLVCKTLGACLQYLVLVQLSWMMIIAYVQFNRFVKVFGSNYYEYFVIKSFFIGWVVPLIPVLLVVFLDPESYIPRETSGSAICYPTGRSFYIGLCLPVAIATVGNLIIYIAVIYSIAGLSIRDHSKQRLRSQIRVSFLLFFLLGLTWIFGLLALMTSKIVFSYLFSITTTIQGFVLFVHFILIDPVTRKLWSDFFLYKLLKMPDIERLPN